MVDPKVPKPLKKSYFGITLFLILVLCVIFGYFFRSARALMWVGIIFLVIWLIIKILELISDFMP